MTANRGAGPPNFDKRMEVGSRERNSQTRGAEGCQARTRRYVHRAGLRGRVDGQLDRYRPGGPGPDPLVGSHRQRRQQPTVTLERHAVWRALFHDLIGEPVDYPASIASATSTPTETASSARLVPSSTDTAESVSSCPSTATLAVGRSVMVIRSSNLDSGAVVNSWPLVLVSSA
jgi:hypothetical protein